MSFTWTHSAFSAPSPNEAILNDCVWLWSHLSWICMWILNMLLNRYICNILKRTQTFAQYLHLSNEFVTSFFKFIFNWRIIGLQYYLGFCHLSIWMKHRCTYVPSLLSLPPTPSRPSRLSQSTRFELPASCSNFQWLSNFTYGNVCVSVPLSQFIPPSPSQWVCNFGFDKCDSSKNKWKTCRPTLNKLMFLGLNMLVTMLVILWYLISHPKIKTVYGNMYSDQPAATNLDSD